jgi:1,2-phenylacetyl-CoA epoxidase PaaB subunit
MLYDANNNEDVKRSKEYHEKLIKQKAKFEIVNKNRRTNDQNSYLHAIISFFAADQGYCLHEAKEYFYKAVANNSIFAVKTKDGKGYYLRSSKDLTTKEMTVSIEKFRNFSSLQGCYLPSPEEYKGDWLKFEQQIVKYQEYL